MKKNKYTLILGFIFLIIVSNMFFTQNMALAVVSGILYLWLSANLLGKNMFKTENKCLNQLLGFIFLLVLIITSGTIMYYAIGLFNWSISIVLLMPLICIFILQKKHTDHQDANTDPTYSLNFCLNKNNKKTKLLYFVDGIYFGLVLALFYILFMNKTTEAILSPWTVVPSHFFVVYFLATSILLYKIFIYTEKTNLILIALHTLLTSCVAVIIYKIGYGFDPFIHRATEQIILNNGFILPKNPYYIGQYSLIVILTKIFQSNINLIDKILVPILSSLTIPFITFFTLLKFNLKEKISQIIALIAPLFILWTIFFTVPQNLANILLIIFIFFIFIYIKNHTIKLNHLWLMAVAIACVHPLAGMPALITIWMLSIKNKKIKILSTLIFFISVPVIFYLLSFILPDFNTSINLVSLKTRLISNFSFSYLPFYSFLHSIYFLKSLFVILTIFLAGLGFWKLYKKQKQFLIFPFISLILLVNSFLLSAVSLNSIIYYEQNVFPIRLIYFAYFFILPLVFCAIYDIIETTTQNKKNIFLIITVISFIITIFLYLSYPTYDIINKNKGYAVSQTDIDAVHKIQETANTDNYVVLANQSTSATALQEFGFKKYFTTAQGQLFYYPIPTSSPIYSIYLDITYNGIKSEYITKIKNITGVDEVFLIFSDYWTNFKKLTAEGTATAKKTFNINNKIYIFQY